MDPRVLIGTVMLLLGGSAGWVMHRSGYCLTAMFRDWCLFGSKSLLRSYALLVAATAVLFELARVAGAVPQYPYPLLTPPIFAGVLGGVLFGIGMVLAGGCVVGTLYKMGTGNAVNATAFAGLILGSALYAEIHPYWAGFAARTRWDGAGITLPQLTGVAPGWFVVLLVGASGVAFWRWHRAGVWSRNTAVEGYLQPWRAALVLSVISVISYCIAGMPLGITTCYVKMAAAMENLVAPGHVASVAFFNAVPLQLELPWAGIQLSGGPGPGWDDIALVQGFTILGLVLGGGVSAATLGEWSLQTSAPGRQFLSALAGGVLLAVGSRTSFGCNVWFLLGGIPIFATQSLLFLGGLLPGTWLGTQLLTRVVVPPQPAGPAKGNRMSPSIESRELDIRGQICPSTLLTALREVNLHKEALKTGDLRLVILTDARDAVDRIPNAVDNMGYPVTVAREERHYRITVGGIRG